MRKLSFVVFVLLLSCSSTPLSYAAGGGDSAPPSMYQMVAQMYKSMAHIEKSVDILSERVACLESVVCKLKQTIGDTDENPSMDSCPSPNHDVCTDKTEQDPEKMVKITMMATLDTNVVSGYIEPFVKYRRGKTYEVPQDVADYWTTRGIARKSFEDCAVEKKLTHPPNKEQVETYVSIIPLRDCTLKGAGMQKGWSKEVVSNTRLSNNRQYEIEYSKAMELVQQGAAKLA